MSRLWRGIASVRSHSAARPRSVDRVRRNEVRCSAKGAGPGLKGVGEGAWYKATLAATPRGGEVT